MTHIAVVRYGSGMFMYVNGVVQNATENVAVGGSAIGSFAASLAIGGSSQYLNGYMDHVRITKGKALWTTTNFNLSDKGLYYPEGTLNI